MNPVEIEKLADGMYALTLPDGSKQPYLSKQDMIKALEHKAEEFQKAKDDILKQIEKYMASD